MTTKRDKMLLYIADQIRLAGAEIHQIPPSSPSHKVMARLIASMSFLHEIVKEISDGEPGE